MKILLLVDLKPDEIIDQLTDTHLLRTIGAFYSTYGKSNEIVVISLRDLPKFAKEHGLIFDDIYMIGHGEFSTLGSGLSVEDCGLLFKEAFENISDESKLKIGHLHLSVCHSAEINLLIGNTSLLQSVHKNLSSTSNTPILISGYQGQIHLVRAEKFLNGIFIIDSKMPFASIIHKGLQPLRKKYDCRTLTGYTIGSLFDFAKFCQDGTIPPKEKRLFEILRHFAQTANALGGGEMMEQIERDYNQYKSLNEYSKFIDKVTKKLNIKTDTPISLNDKYQAMSIDELSKTLEEMRDKYQDNKVMPNAEEFIQIRLAWQAKMKEFEELDLALAKNFNAIRRNLYESMFKYLKGKIAENDPDINSIIIDLCYQTTQIVKEIYFKGGVLDLAKRLSFLQELDGKSVLSSTDNLDIKKLYLMEPQYIFTCNTNEHFPTIPPLNPTIYWEKGFWKELLDIVPSMHKEEEIVDTLEYICKNYEAFKSGNHPKLMVDILTVLPSKLIALINHQETSRFLTKLVCALPLFYEHNEVAMQLDNDTLAEWKTFIDLMRGLTLKTHFTSYWKNQIGWAEKAMDIILKENENKKRTECSTGMIFTTFIQTGETTVSNLSIPLKPSVNEINNQDSKEVKEKVVTSNEVVKDKNETLTNKTHVESESNVPVIKFDS